MGGKRYFIVGDGAAGITAARSVRQRDANASITIASDEPHPAYYRAALTNYLLGELKDEQLWATTPDFYSQQRVDRVLARAVRVDPTRREVWLSQGTAEPYDALLIASGSRPRPPPFPVTVQGVFTFRTLADARQIVQCLATGRVRDAIVVGGGPLGLEWALGLQKRGARVTVLVRDDRLLASALDRVASDLLILRLKQAGVQVLCRAQAVQVMADAQGWVQGLALADGRTLNCQFVGVAIGCVPNTEFLQGSGIALGSTGAVVVDESMRSSVAGIFAAGDVAECSGEVLGFWEPAQKKGRIAAQSMCGIAAAYRPGVHYNATRLFDLDFSSVGHIGDTNTTESLVDFPQGTGRIAYRKLVFRGGQLVGAMMLGHPEERVRTNGRLFKRIIDEGIDVQSVKQRLLERDFDLRAWLERDGLVRPAATHAAGTTQAAQAVMKGTRLIRAIPDASAEPAASREAPARVSRTFAVMESGSLPPEAPRSAAPDRSPEPTDDAVLDGLGTTFPLNRNLTTIGRDPSSHIVIPGAEADLTHAHIQRFEDGHYLRDMGSRNGTWLNGEALVVPHRLTTGDTLVIGGAALAYRSSRSERPKARAPNATSMSQTARVEVRAGPGTGVSFTLGQNPTGIGSAADCGVFLQDPSVAPRHAELRKKGSIWHLVDLGHGTWLGEQRLAPHTEVPLAEGACIAVGTVRLVFTHSLTQRAATRMLSANELAAARAAVAPGRPAGAFAATPAPPAARPNAPVGTPAATPAARGLTPAMASRTAASGRVAMMPAVAPGAGAASPGPGPATPGQVAEPSAAAGPRIRVMRSGRPVGLHELQDTVVVGRTPGQCQVVVDAADILPYHCELRRYQGATYIRDLGSPGRTALSGRVIGQEYVPLRAGDWVQLGADTILIYEEGT